MADTVTTRTLRDTPRQLVVQLTGISDGTGEAAVTKVDKSTFLAAPVGTAAAAEPASLDIDRIDYAITGFPYVKLLWDHTTDDGAIVLPAGAAELHFDDPMGDGASAPVLTDPRSTGGTGDILLTSPAAATNGVYLIVLYLRKQPS